MSGSRIGEAGVSVAVPRGWEVGSQRTEGGGAGAPLSSGHLVLHAANFALPASRGDFGGGAVELMGRGAVFLAVVEYDREAAQTALFARRGVPRELPAELFSPTSMQRTIPGQSGLQVFANEQGRAWCLYVVLGSHQRRSVLTPVVNEVLGTLRIEPA